MSMSMCIHSVYYTHAHNILTVTEYILTVTEWILLKFLMNTTYTVHSQYSQCPAMNEFWSNLECVLVTNNLNEQMIGANTKDDSLYTEEKWIRIWPAE